MLTAIYRGVDQYAAPDYILLDTLGFTAITVIYIGIVMYFAISVYQRVMQKSIRNYLLVFCGMSITWILLRNMKWRAFESFGFEGRFMWYLFYIPMLLIPMYGFFIALSIGKGENYKPNTKWKVLYVIAFLLIGMVVTNDLHQFVFAFQPNFVNWDYVFSYGFAYPIVLSFMSAIIMGTVFTLFRKWRKINRTKKAHLPLVVVGMGFIYLMLYLTKRNLAVAITDLTTFNMLIYIMFWESCIQVGMIPSNSKHNDFFKYSKVNAQILDQNGKANLISSQATSILEEDFIHLKQKGNITDKDTSLHMASITSGHVVWTKDISKLNKMNRELGDLQDELYGDVAFLEEERKLKEEYARIQKLNNIYDLISKEIVPTMDKIEELIINAKTEDEQEQDRILKQINLISCYIKRKTNLLLQSDSGKSITNTDMINCYNESFRGLGLFGIGCDINYAPPTNTSIAIHLLSYDLFEEVLERANFALEMVFVNCMEDGSGIRFGMELSNNKNISQWEFSKFKQEELKVLGGELKVYEYEDSMLVLLLFPKSKEVG